jgi:ADP-L-glycero-D-manno-heptose 6-epimerase
MLVVTGASGFIGSNLVAELNRRGRSDLLAVDDYPRLRGSARPAASPANARYLQSSQIAGLLDMQDLAGWLDRAGDQVEAILHLGACSDTTVTDRQWVMEVNYRYTQRLWQWCAQAARPLIYASSAATYGDGAAGYDDECLPNKYRPLNLYGESKHLFDLWALEQANTPPRWAGLKYFNVYGPHENHKGRMASVVYHGFQQIRDTGQIRLFQSHREGIPDGGQKRDFIFVQDVVEATLHFLDPSGSWNNGLYNVGVGCARTFSDLADAVFAALGRSPRIDYIPMPADLRSRYQYFTEAKVDKLRGAGFRRPMRSLEEGVRQYVQDYLLGRHHKKRQGDLRSAVSAGSGDPRRARGRPFRRGRETRAERAC